MSASPLALTENVSAQATLARSGGLLPVLREQLLRHPGVSVLDLGSPTSGVLDYLHGAPSVLRHRSRCVTEPLTPPATDHGEFGDAGGYAFVSSYRWCGGRRSVVVSMTGFPGGVRVAAGIRAAVAFA